VAESVGNQSNLRDTADRRILMRTASVVILVASTGALLLAWCIAHGYSIDEQAKAVAIAKDSLTIIALVLGGFWTVRIYLKQRVDASAVDVRQSVTVIRFPEGKWLLKVNLAIHNVGKTRVQLSEWRYRADVILPLTPEGEEMMKNIGAFSKLHAPWPSIAETTLREREFGLSIEPGATQTESANILLPKFVEVVQIYSFLTEATNRDRGWWDQTIIDLQKETTNGLPTP
jgi:hypothetical protein